MGRLGAAASQAKQGKKWDAKAASRRKKIGATGILGGRGGSPADRFLAQFRNRQAGEQDAARQQVVQRLQAAGKGGGLFSRLFGGGR